MSKSAKRVFCIALVLILVSCIFASLIQTDFGKVQITTVNIVTDSGSTLCGHLYRPKDATAENPLPGIVTCHGNYNNKEMQDVNAIELSRRGYVVLNVDEYRHGHSSPADFETWHMTSVDAVDYLYELDFVDQSLIAVTGHSRGAKMANEAMKENLIRAAAGQPMKLKAVLIVGSAPWFDSFKLEDATVGGSSSTTQSFTLTSELEALMEEINALVDLAVNYGVIYASCDEWNTMCDSVGGDVRRFLESDKAIDFVDQIGAGLEHGQKVEDGKFYYGEIDGETYSRVIFVNKEIHPLNHFSKASAADLITYFYTVLGVPAGHEEIANTNQVWLLKEIMNLIGLIGLFMLIYPLACAFMKLPFFSELAAAETPRKLPGFTGSKDKLIYWLQWILYAAIPPLLLFPVEYKWIGAGSGAPSTYNDFFGQPNTNELVVWSLCITALSLIVYILMFKFYYAKRGRTLDDIGVRISAKRFFKSLLLSALVVAILYYIVFLADFLFKVDFRIWVIAVKTFEPMHLVLALTYVIGFAVFYIGNSLFTNSNRIEGWAEWKVLLVSCIGNILGISIIIAFQYITFASTGHLPLNAMRVVNLFPLVVLIPIATIIGRKFYDKTGNIYLGGIVMGIFYTFVTVANTRTDGFWLM